MPEKTWEKQTMAEDLELELQILRGVVLLNLTVPPLIDCGGSNFGDIATLENELHCRLLLEQQLAHSAARKIENIKKVLDMLKNGQDVNCEVCGRNIPFERLLVAPCCLCIVCAYKKEEV